LSLFVLLVDGFQHSPDLIGFEVLNVSNAGAFDGNGKKPLARFQILWVARGSELRKGMDRCQTCVAGSGSVSTVCLQMVEEGDQIVRAKVIKIQVDNVASMAFSQVPEKEDKGITVAAYGF
jgi:hypothetical protein